MITGTYYTTCNQLAIVICQSADYLGDHLFGYTFNGYDLLPQIWKLSGANVYRDSLDLDLNRKLSDKLEDITNWEPLKMEKGQYLDFDNIQWTILGKDINGNWVGYSTGLGHIREFNHTGKCILDCRPHLVKQTARMVEVDG